MSEVINEVIDDLAPKVYWVLSFLLSAFLVVKFCTYIALLSIGLTSTPLLVQFLASPLGNFMFIASMLIYTFLVHSVFMFFGDKYYENYFSD